MTAQRRLLTCRAGGTRCVGGRLCDWLAHTHRHHGRDAHERKKQRALLALRRYKLIALTSSEGASGARRGRPSVHSDMDAQGSELDEHRRSLPEASRLEALRRFARARPDRFEASRLGLENFEPVAPMFVQILEPWAPSFGRCYARHSVHDSLWGRLRMGGGTGERLRRGQEVRGCALWTWRRASKETRGTTLARCSRRGPGIHRAIASGYDGEYDESYIVGGGLYYQGFYRVVFEVLRSFFASVEGLQKKGNAHDIPEAAYPKYACPLHLFKFETKQPLHDGTFRLRRINREASNVEGADCFCGVRRDCSGTEI